MTPSIKSTTRALLSTWLCLRRKWTRASALCVISSISVDNLAQWTFCADLAEINREYPGHKLDQMINRSDIAVEEFCYVLLKDIGVADVNPAQPEINDQRRDKGL